MPLRDDYIMRLIEQLGETVGVLVGLRQRREPEKEITTIDEALKRMLGLNGKLVNGLSEADLVGLLTKEGYGELERLAVVAVLLKEQADAYDRMQQQLAAYQTRKKALYLLLHVGVRGTEPDFVKLSEEIDGLVGQLRPYALPVDTRKLLWRYYEELGRYAAAEDVLYELMEEEPVGAAGATSPASAAPSPLLAEAIAFYERLMKLDEEQLQAGNLPLDEVEEALGKLKQQAEQS